MNPTSARVLVIDVADGSHGGPPVGGGLGGVAPGGQFDCAEHVPAALRRLAEEQFDRVLLSLPVDGGSDTAPGGATFLGVDPASVAARASGLRRGHDGKDEPLGSPEAEALLRAVERLRLSVAECARARQWREEALSAVVANSPDGLLVVDAEGTVRFANPAAEALLGADADGLVGQPFGFPLRAGGSVEVEVQRPDGAAMVDLRAAPLCWEGSPAHVVALRDVSARSRESDRRDERAAELARSNRALEEFARVASHDLQEPVRKILAFGGRLESACRDALDERGAESLSRIMDAARRMRELIDGLLAYARLDGAGGEMAAVDLGETAAQVVRELESQVESSGGRVEVGPLPTVEAEPCQMHSLFQNLVSNALKFRREEEPPVVRVYAPRNEAPGDAECRILVEDNGVGFDAQHADQIFGLFKRLHGRSRFQGSGLGLAMCRKIVERHGGRIEARGEPGRGATFTITLPRRQPTEEESP
ncbi:MAG: sensor histidine kinase [Candidatus Brocadiia bacterium]